MLISGHVKTEADAIAVNGSMNSYMGFRMSCCTSSHMSGCMCGGMRPHMCGTCCRICSSAFRRL